MFIDKTTSHLLKKGDYFYMDYSLDLSEYKELLHDIKERILSAQYEALKTVNKELITLYWDIGRMIVGKQEHASWGKSVVEQLAKDLQSDFPGFKGFSSRNIWYMRNFYLCYSTNIKLQPLVAEIGWTHNLIIMEKCKDDLQREFYMRLFQARRLCSEMIIIYLLRLENFTIKMLPVPVWLFL